MFSAISSYLFGDDATEIEVNDAVGCDEESTVDDWILVDHVSIDGETISSVEHPDSDSKQTKNDIEESWYVTPPSCFSCQPKEPSGVTSKLENLLIEHPSMSVYGPNLVKMQEDGVSPEQSADKSSVVLKSSGQNTKVGQGKIFLCQAQGKRTPLKDLGCNYAEPFGQAKTRKSSRNSNKTQHRNLHGQHRKQLNRRAGKHVGMVGKRAK